ncbi:CAP domain-containing protein [Lactobacillus delbrueckii]|uniref:CAP domain-containing protein n=1 Tax=Lactobacillus delbrueckii TaxID=1584 RepID=UPI0021A89DE0|nr:CAP domain-containing protein [Lactobacillus delbrueckii]MCT3509257.1 hypothetical protein [Lactobacillus delbrueckii subsp. bulgaricus]
MRKQITVLAALAALLRLVTTTTNPVYAKTTTKKVTRTIKIYKPGKYTQVKQTATLKKKGRKWTTSKWKSYKASSVSGYKSSTDNSLSSQSQLRQADVNVVNSFRAKAGVKAVKMSSKYNAVLDKRATEKAKQYVTTVTYDHSGYNSLLRYLSTYPIVNGKIIYYGSETLHACYYNAQSGDATAEMKSSLTSTFTENMQAEKDDYQAIVVKKTRKNITNISGTYEHYTMMVDSGNHTAYIGVGHYGSGSNAMVCVVIEFHA